MTNMGGCKKNNKKKKERRRSGGKERERRVKRKESERELEKIFSWLAVIWQPLRPLSLNLISPLFA